MLISDLKSTIDEALAPLADSVNCVTLTLSGPNSRPRVMIVKFHYYQDKERALRVSRDKLIYRGDRVTFYPDYSMSVNKKRVAFNPVKTLLYQRGVKFRMIFPAVLKVDFNPYTTRYIFYLKPEGSPAMETEPPVALR